MATQLLPANPSLQHLRTQAKDLLRAWRRADPEALREVAAVLPATDGQWSLSQAQHVIARRYSFGSWPRLKQFVDTYDTQDIRPAATELRQAIDANQLALIERLLDAHPELLDEHVARSKSRYSNQRPLIYAARTARAEVVQLLLRRGADPTADGHLALARAALNDAQLPVLRILLDQGIDPNVDAYDWGPLILTPCETLAPEILAELLARGADPNRVNPAASCTESPVRMVLGTYARAASRAARCLDLLIAAGAQVVDSPALDVHRGRLAALAARLDAEPGLRHAPLTGLAYGMTGGRSLTADGGTLLHLAVEFCAVEVVRFLLARGAPVDIPAQRDAQGRGCQTPLFHAVAHYHDWGVATTALLLEHGADPNLVCTVRGSMHQPEAFVTGSAYDYARAFPPGRDVGDPTLTLLRRHGGRERG